MQIEGKGRGVEVTDEIRAYVDKRFGKSVKQVPDAISLHIELREQEGKHHPEQFVAEASLQVKGTTLRASDTARDMMHAVHLVSDELSVQVKRYQEKRRGRRGEITAA